jgi:hypothetical protein
MPANQKLMGFGDTPYASPYYSIGVEDCINLYLEKAITLTSKIPNYYISIPGLQLFSQQTSTDVCRGLYRTADQRLFGVFGANLVEILQNGQRLIKGSITTYSGTVGMVDNTHQLFLVDGAFGYILELSTNVFSQIDPDTFVNGATHCDCIDTQFLANQPNSINYNWSNNNDGLTWDPLNFADKEGLPDNIVAIKGLSNQLWVFGSYSTEVHYDTGDITTQQWQRYEGAVIDIGCSAPYSVAKVEGNIFWIGSDKAGNAAVWSNNALTPVKISNRGIEQLIHSFANNSGGQINDAFGYTYAQAGHVFYVLTFPSADLTIVYDMTTGQWHRRTFLDTLGVEHKWQGYYQAYIWGLNIFGDNTGDGVYQLSVDYYLNDNPNGVGYNQIKRTRTTPVIQINQKRVRHNSIQIIFEQGVGLINSLQLGYGVNPQCILYTSDDSGFTFQNGRTADIGAIGNYQTRTIFRCLGHSRNRVYRVIVSDPIQVILVGFTLDLEELDF